MLLAKLNLKGHRVTRTVSLCGREIEEEREREKAREQEREREKYAMVKFVGRGTPEYSKRYHFVQHPREIKATAHTHTLTKGTCDTRT